MRSTLQRNATGLSDNLDKLVTSMRHNFIESASQHDTYSIPLSLSLPLSACVSNTVPDYPPPQKRKRYHKSNPERGAGGHRGVCWSALEYVRGTTIVLGVPLIRELAERHDSSASAMYAAPVTRGA